MRITTRTAATVARPAAALITGVNRSVGMTPHGLTLAGWHRLGPVGKDGLTTSFDDFRGHLDVLEEWGANILPLNDAVARLEAGTLPDRAVALTFDDGYASVAEHAWPELKKRGMPATLFAVSGYLDPSKTFPWDRHRDDRETVRLMDPRALCDVADDGLDIGSHTVSHRWLRHLAPAEVAAELVISREELEGLLQRPVLSFAYPMGGWTRRIRDQVDRAGYRIAITVDRARNRRGQHPLSLRRWFAFDRASDFRMQLDGGFSWLRPVETFKRRNGPGF
ncbi:MULTISPECIES: polysaccharide deacetylase family protein [Nocardioides]|uniref:Polysaccharide deacetylase family protein n=1 Tax=Nocardioides vastitatis TaxID=2568655 RepID=A0ABW0ZFB4_9ACTN|nr:polysaccharide deacetylase family protein [Nocardioides sp.]THI98886.1 polysaccharide deacetylase family protein [Nocardioides sp.]